ncbi:N-acetyltransferase [Gordonia sp. X0973]|uniref:GNAT family N-acetyltransferase n=1 Tax=Gordonia sp. X0973 TaxID=2742602 RepID=UPI000F524448|nr:GNAT family N-acetyltransferase [Gordonia sp. X0973]QKT06107.1 N-acetyltransferase [Gordonia sp. X0973]
MAFRKKSAQQAAPTPSAQVMAQISQIQHNPDRERFELWVAGDLVGVLGYHAEKDEAGEVVTVLHTVLYDEYTGQGLATRLTGSAVDYIKQTGARLRPVCTFTRHYLDNHPGVVPLAAV